jgi:hypothetical protein
MEVACETGNDVVIDGVPVSNSEEEGVEWEVAEDREDAEDWDAAEFTEVVESKVDAEGCEDVAASWRVVVPLEGPPTVVDAAKAASSSANEGPSNVSVLGTEQSRVPPP